MRRVEGVTHNAISAASALHNVRKALEVLHKKNSIPIKYFYSEEEIFKGNPDVIIGLLKHIRKVYKNSEEMYKLTRARSINKRNDGKIFADKMCSSLSKKEQKKFSLYLHKAWN